MGGCCSKSCDRYLVGGPGQQKGSGDTPKLARVTPAAADTVAPSSPTKKTTTKAADDKPPPING